MDHKTLVFQFSFISHDMYKKNIYRNIHTQKQQKIKIPLNYYIKVNKTIRNKKHCQQKLKLTLNINTYTTKWAVSKIKLTFSHTERQRHQLPKYCFVSIPSPCFGLGKSRSPKTPDLFSTLLPLSRFHPFHTGVPV